MKVLEEAWWECTCSDMLHSGVSVQATQVSVIFESIISSLCCQFEGRTRNLEDVLLNLTAGGDVNRMDLFTEWDPAYTQRLIEHHKTLLITGKYLTS